MAAKKNYHNKLYIEIWSYFDTDIEIGWMKKTLMWVSSYHLSLGLMTREMIRTLIYIKHFNLLSCMSWLQALNRTNCSYSCAYEPPHDKTNKMTLRPAKTQTRMPRLIWVFAGRRVILLVLSWSHSNVLIIQINTVVCPLYSHNTDCSVQRVKLLSQNLLSYSKGYRHDTFETDPAKTLANVNLTLLQKCLKYYRSYKYDRNWATSWQNQQCGCAPSEDSDQPGHPPRLIRVFAVRSMGS